MKKLSKIFIVLSIVLNIITVSFFIMGFTKPSPNETSATATKIYIGNGFDVYRIIVDMNYLYVIKSTDGKPVAIK
jgi:hypothetical protein